jgi:hypothetical protein
LFNAIGSKYQLFVFEWKETVITVLFLSPRLRRIGLIGIGFGIGLDLWSRWEGGMSVTGMNKKAAEAAEAVEAVSWRW